MITMTEGRVKHQAKQPSNESRIMSEKINIETQRSSTLEKRVILVQGPC